MLYETHFLLSLCVTWVIEIPLLFLLVRYIVKANDLSAAWIAGTGLLASALTLPYLWFVLPPYIDAAYYPLIGELLVIAGEAAVFFLLLRVKPVSAVFLSLVVNVSSFGIGMWPR
jgi:hypothetical protein